MPHQQRQVRVALRVTLLSVIAGILLAALGGIGAAVYELNTRSADGVLKTQTEMAAGLVGAMAGQMIKQSEVILDRMANQAALDLLPLGQPGLLALQFAQELRATNTLSWISYGDAATGAFTGATRRNNEILINQSSPAENGGIPREARLDADGTLTPVELPFLSRKPYDARSQGWFKKGLERPGNRWTEIYAFTEGGFGITGLRQIKNRAGTVVGVATVDFALSAVEDYLRRIRVGELGRVFILVPTDDVASGERKNLWRILGRSEGPRMEGAERAVGMAVASFLPLDRTNMAIIETNLVIDAIEYRVRIGTIALGPELPWRLAVVTPTSEITAPIEQSTEIILIIGLLTLGVGLALAWVLASAVANPISAMAADLRRVGRLEIRDDQSPASFVAEVSRMGQAIDRMKGGLKSFSRYVPAGLVRRILESGEASLGGQRRELTVLFTDIEGFTDIAGEMSPEDLLGKLSTYFLNVAGKVVEGGGTIDKYIGDAIMAFWNAPEDAPDHARLACLTALRMRKATDALNATWASHGRPGFVTRIGVHTGDCIVGNVGSTDRLSYTAIGAPVNIASRLEALNKIYGSYTLVSNATLKQAGPDFVALPIDIVRPKGVAEPVMIHCLFGYQGDDAPELRLPQQVLQNVEKFKEAFNCYKQRDFVGALTMTEDLLSKMPLEDPGARKIPEIFAERCRAMIANPPPADWDGVTVMLEK